MSICTDAGSNDTQIRSEYFISFPITDLALLQELDVEACVLKNTQTDTPCWGHPSPHGACVHSAWLEKWWPHQRPCYRPTEPSTWALPDHNYRDTQRERWWGKTLFSSKTLTQTDAGCDTFFTGNEDIEMKVWRN